MSVIKDQNHTINSFAIKWASYYARLTLVLWLLTMNLFAQTPSGEIILSGIYQGNNLFIQNPLAGSVNEFCIQEIHVNDELVLSNPRISAIEIKLTQFKVNDQLTVRITHYDNCTPNIINPQIVVFVREFEFLSAQATPDSIKWITKGEKEAGEFTVQRFENNRWNDLARVSAQGSFDLNYYGLPLAHQPGTNMYRIVIYTSTGKEISSNNVEYMYEQRITFSPVQVSDKITLSGKAFYEVYDLEGNQITKGEGTEIKLAGLPTGQYNLYINQRKEVFYKE